MSLLVCSVTIEWDEFFAATVYVAAQDEKEAVDIAQKKIARADGVPVAEFRKRPQVAVVDVLAIQQNLFGGSQ